MVEFRQLEKLLDIALKYEIGFHVDGCLNWLIDYMLYRNFDMDVSKDWHPNHSMYLPTIANRL